MVNSVTKIPRFSKSDPVPAEPGPNCKYRRLYKNRLFYDFEKGYQPLATYDEDMSECSEAKLYFAKRTYTLFSIHLLIICLSLYTCLSDRNLIALCSNK